MKLLKDRIQKEGKVIRENIVKVDSFLNHQIDTILMNEIGHEFFSRYKDEKITKILTIESSGIACALTTGLQFNSPVVFAKKHKSLNIDGECYVSKVYSFTKKTEYDVTVSKEYLTKDDNVLIIDDFLALGNALNGLIDIVNQSGARLAGVGVVIEKTFQNGGKEIREKNIRVESLARIKEISDKGVVFDD